MPSAVSPNPRAGSDPPDDLDKLLDYDNAVENFLRDIPISNEAQNTAKATEQPRDEDQEVQVKKKRKPVPKLDENLLLSQNGIPKLRKIAKTRLKFGGKGHEFSDISRLLSTYQLWLDDLYPRAKFRDALTMVEKVGHSKRMQVMRKAWLDDTKPHRQGLSPEVEMSGANGDTYDSNESPQDTHNHREDSITGESLSRNLANPPTGGPADAPEDDELDALLAESGNPGQPRRKRKGPFVEDDSDDDELNALLDEADHKKQKRDEHQSQSVPLRGDPDEDDLDALMAEQHPAMPEPEHAAKQKPYSAQSTLDEADFADDEEALASMGW